MCKARSRVPGKVNFLILLGLIYLTACTLVGLDSTPTPTAIQDPTFIDRSWLTGDPCLPPCWNGMEFGKTTFEEASRLVRSLPFIDPHSIDERESNYVFFPYPTPAVPGKRINLYCRQPENELCARLWFVEDVLVDIFLFPNYHITFLEAVDQLGEPDFLDVNPLSPDRCHVSIIWVEYQMRIAYVEFYKNDNRRLCQLVSDSEYKIPKDLSVWSVSIWAKERFIDLDHWTINPWKGFIDP
jgi:hypothetical protein